MTPGSATAPRARAPRAAVTDRALAVVRAHAPPGVDVQPLEALADLREVDFLVPPSRPGPLLDDLPALTRLQVIQVLSAGTDWIEDRVPPQATLCSARGARDAPVSEWIVGALLGASTRLLRGARLTAWPERRPLDDLGRWTVLIVGMGSIGQMVKHRLEPFGTTVVGVASRARNGLHGVDELGSLLPRADAVVILAPLTAQTRGLIGAVELAAMRDGALLVNAARGPLVDTAALVRETESGRLAAVLDVTDPEPLPDGHPLWTAPGVLSITPHIAGDSPAGWENAARLAGEQLARWCAGEPLRNVVRAATR